MSSSAPNGKSLPLATVIVGALAAVAVVLSVVALATDDEPAAAGDDALGMEMGGMSMGSGAIEHMEPLSTEGISCARCSPRQASSPRPKTCC